MVEFVQLCLFSNQLAEFCDHQYLGKVAIDVLDFIHEDNNQGKVASETEKFWLGVAGCATF